MDDKYFKKIATLIILGILIIFVGFMLRPILLSIILAFLLAFMFSPVYDKIFKKIKNKDISATIISITLIALIVLPIWFFTPIVMDESLKIYSSVQDLDIVTPLQKFLPPIFASEQFSNEIGSIISSFIRNSVNSFINGLTKIILDFPVFLLHLFLIFFIFYVTLKEKKEIISYIKSLLPFSSDIEKRLFTQTKGITSSILYGQFLIGMLQGIIAGVGFFIAGVPNALLLTVLAAIAGIFPMIGTTLIWIPVLIYAALQANLMAFVIVLSFGIFSSIIDNILKPVFISKRTDLPSSIILVGMVGGFLFFGVLGFILGPLILAYLLIIIDIFRDKSGPDILTPGKAESKLQIRF